MRLHPITRSNITFQLNVRSSVDKVSGLKVTALGLGILYTVAAIIQGFGLVVVSMVSPQRRRFRLPSMTYYNM